MPAGQSRVYRFGFDIGGTFTDLVLAPPEGPLAACKVLSRQEDIVAPILEGLGRMLAAEGIAPAQVAEIAGATTVVTNLVIERKGVPTGLIATRGFADVIDIGRELRYDIYDLEAPYPEPLVPPGLRAELDERIDHRGEVVRAVDDSEIAAALRRLADAGAKSVAVCLLHAYRNPAHEMRVRAVAEHVAPGLPVSLSSEVVPEIREYERTVATVLNAYVMPVVADYLARIESGLQAHGVIAHLRIMQSNGGIISRELGQRLPLRMLESGPAAGALGAARLARRAGVRNLLAFDMGGTTAKACLISEGEPEITTEFEAARVRRFKKGSGLPVRLPIIDLIEIGAGGGSIAEISPAGLLKVGPHSAGSNPGPACYGRGGTAPTVTDAALVLGYLDPAGSLSGEVVLRPELAERAIEQQIAAPLGMSVIEAALGIHHIVCEHMAAAVRIHAAEKGKDLRRYALLAFGGAGPLHAREVARRVGCAEIRVPADAGVFSAVGLLAAPLKIDAVRTRYARLRETDLEAIEALYADMAERLCAELAACGATKSAIVLRRSADMRYVGQGFEVITPLSDELRAGGTALLEASFHEAYERQYGQRLADQPIEALNWRLEATASVTEGAVRARSAPAALAEARTRVAYFDEAGGFVPTAVIPEHELADGAWRGGPALIEQAGSTVVIGPGERYRMDEDGSLHVLLGEER